jgi:hypothetical protein
MINKCGISLILLGIIACHVSANPYSWVRTGADSGAVSGKMIVLDGNRNIYTCGKLSGTAMFDTVKFFGTGSFFVSYTNDGACRWAVSLPGIDCRNVSVDYKGFSYITGSFTGTTHIGKTAFTSQGGADLFLAKFDTLGRLVWARAAGGPGNDISNAVGNDFAGNTYITGSFENYVNFDTSNSLVSGGLADIFLAKYDSNGVVRMVAKAGGLGEDAGTALTLDRFGYIYVSGYFSETASFRSQKFVSNGGKDAFLAKYHPGGLIEFVHAYGSTGDDLASSVSLDGSGDIFLTGTFNGSINFDGNLVSSQQKDAFLVMLNNSTGLANWAIGLGGPGDDAGMGVSADGASNAVVTGAFSGSARFGNKLLQSAGGTDIYIAKFDALGKLLWAESAGGTGDDSGISVCLEHDDIPYITGNFQHKSAFGDAVITSVGNSAYFFAKMAQDPTGIHEPELINPNVLIYPNPAAGNFHITGFGKIKSIIVENLEGSEVKHFSGDSDHDFNVSDLPGGIYLVRVLTEKSMLSRKLVIER